MKVLIIALLAGCVNSDTSKHSSLVLTSIKSGEVVLETSNIVYLEDVINDTARKGIVEQFGMAVNNKEPIALVINSTGGSVPASKEIIRLLSYYQDTGYTIYCIVTGEAKSMAANILSYCDHRYAGKDSEILFHHIYYGFLPPDGLKLNVKIFKQYIADLTLMESPLTKQNLKALKISGKEYEKACDEEKTWTSEELVKMKYLDDVVVIKDRDRIY